MKPFRRFLCGFLLSAALATAQTGFLSMFNGRNLDGWDGDPRLWSVENGAIVGSTDGVPIDHNTFLISAKKYKNFIFRTQVKLRNHNSGIQFRSEELPNWVVRGLQADMAENGYWGNIYDERGTRGTVVDGWKGKAEKVVRLQDWNEYEVYCKGDLIRLTVNGLVTAELHDPITKDKEGVIALQMHMGKPMRVEFRNLRIKILK